MNRLADAEISSSFAIPRSDDEDPSWKAMLNLKIMTKLVMIRFEYRIPFEYYKLFHIPIKNYLL